MVASPSCTGTTTDTVGSSGTDRLRSHRRRATPRGRLTRPLREHLGAAAIPAECGRQVLRALVLDGEHAAVAGRAERGAERLEAVARSRKQGLHVVALAVAAQQARGGEGPAHHLEM